MRQILLILTSLLLSKFSFAQEINGAYISQNNQIKTIALLVDNYISVTQYEENKYVGTLGGPVYFDGTSLNVTLEYYDTQPDSIGLTKVYHILLSDNKFIANGITFEKAAPKSQDLDGLWRIVGRKSSNNINTIPKGDRKTIKLLVDGYFQWIAINPKEKGFYGTGGGQYSFKNNIYQEQILFFSRDNNRIGQKLSFDGEIKLNQWHHSGKSSKGDPIYEVWERDK